MLPFDLASMIWQIVAFGVAAVAVLVFLLFYFWYLPPISRDMAKAKHSGHLPAFIQDETKVKFCVSDKDYPEGLTHHKGKGWSFINKKPDFLMEHDSERVKIKEAFISQKVAEKIESEKLDKKEARKALGRLTEEALEEWDKLNIPTELSEQEKRAYAETQEKLLHTPILEGLGKPVFFGCIDSVALSNLKAISELSGDPQIIDAEKDKQGVVEKIKTLAHANLRNCRLLAPLMYSKTQLAALEAQSILEGQTMNDKTVLKVVIIAIAAACVIGSLGIVAYMLMNGGKA